MKPIAIAAHALVLPGLLRWRDLRDAASAVKLLPETYPVPVGATVPMDPPVPADWPFAIFPRALGLAIAALEKLDHDPGRRYGLALGLPNLFSETDYMEHTLQFRDDPERMKATLGFSHGYPLDYLASSFNISGPLIRVDSACATGNDALITASQWLAAGVVDDVLVVAASAMLNPVGLALFHNLKALADRKDLEASCPFDGRRRGFVMGEGAAAVWLTNNPNQQPKGYLRGYGQSLNADKFVDLPEDVTPMLNACRDALGELEEVAYVSAHGTGTRANDLKETELHKKLFGKRAWDIPISSIKSMIGHCLGAAALIEAIVCLEALNEGIAPPTINLHQPDPRCDLNYVANAAQPIHGNFALSNAFAFGGQNSCILLSKELT